MEHKDKNELEESWSDFALIVFAPPFLSHVAIEVSLHSSLNWYGITFNNSENITPVFIYS